LSIRFAAIGLNHNHIYGQVECWLEAAELVSYFAPEPELVAEFSQKYPQAKPARSIKEILEDEKIHLVTSASIPSERAPLGIQVMKHRKDYLCDKPGFVTLEQLEAVRRVQHMDCSDAYMPFGDQFLQDILNRTETAMTHAHCFLASELALRAQAQAQRLEMAQQV
jgi:hypothetical protein